MSEKNGILSRRAFAAGAALGAAALTIPGAAAQQAPAWPTRPVKFIVPFAPGAGADIGARLAADALSRKWGQGVIVENRPGGDSLIAIRAVVDGNDDHQLLFTPSGNFTPHPYRHEKLGYTRTRDLFPVARFSNTILGVGVAASLGIDSLAEFIELAKKKPNEMNAVVVPGITEFVWDGFVKTVGIDVRKVPYSNLTQGANDMGTGRIQITMSSLAILQPVLQSKGAKMIAVTSRNRVAVVGSHVPTAREAGVPSLELEGLVGVLAPRSMSAEIRKRIGAEIAAVAGDPGIAAKLEATGQVANPGGEQEFDEAIVAQERQVAAIGALLGLKRNG